jgi:uncharacterized phage-associated protein
VAAPRVFGMARSALPSDHLASAYPRNMPVPARVVAERIRRLLPGVPAKKLHKLLYYCQGHHVAIFDQPLFADSISAWDMGPVVGRLWFEEKQGIEPQSSADLDEAEMNTIGYVVSRYGGLSGRDLEILSHNEEPWQRANRGRKPSESSLIRLEWISEWFRKAPEDEDDEVGLLDAEAVASWLRGAEERLSSAVAVDDVESLRGRIADAR